MSVQLRRRRRPKGETGRVLALGCHVSRPPQITGQPHWFQAAMASRMPAVTNRKAREALVKLPLAFLKRFDIPESTIDALSQVGLQNIWALSLAPNPTIRKTRLDTRRLGKLHRVLTENHVRVTWSVS